MAADFDFNLSSYYTALRAADLRAREGKVSKISGMSVEATGLLCSIGDICTIRLERENKEVVAEVVGIAGSTAYLMPYEEIDGIGYDCPVIMAAGAFVAGSSIELSADGPIRPPYAVYFQGGLTWQHGKLGIMKTLQKLVEKGIVSSDFSHILE